MNSESLTSHGSSIAIMLLVNMVLLACTIFAYCHINCPADLRTILTSALTGWNGALLVALRGGGRDREPVNPSPAVPSK